MKKSNKAFTLIEVLLVITLIGILLSIGLVSFNTEARFVNVRNDTRKTHIQILESAITQYKLQEGNYPTGLSRNYQEICDPEATDCTGFFDLKQFLVPNYLQAIPQDPNDIDTTGGTGYSIAVDEATNTVSVIAIQAEANAVIKINDPLPAAPTVTTPTPLAVTVPVTPSSPICPDNYISVPGSSLYGTSDFCVMKYEAKTGSSTVAATTRAEEIPIWPISQTNSIIACNLNNINGITGYGLINNLEWMTIARNIEGVNSNWTGGLVGSGGLWRGHSDGDPNGPLAASTDDNLGYINTNNSAPSIQKRTHTLSNGEIIWDFSGNLWEWNSDTIMATEKPNYNNIVDFQNFAVFNTGGSYGILNYNLIRPSNPNWDTTAGSNENVGEYWAGGIGPDFTNPFAYLRGGSFSINSSATSAGVFALSLSKSTTSNFSSIDGFRCVKR